MRARLLLAAIALGIPAGFAAAAHADPECVVVQITGMPHIRVCRP